MMMSEILCFTAQEKGTNTYILTSKTFTDFSSVDTVIESLKNIYGGQLKRNLAIFEIDARSLAPYITSERDAAMGISKMPLRRFRLREDRIFNNDESSDEEEYEEEMKNAFDLLEEREREKREE